MNAVKQMVVAAVAAVAMVGLTFGEASTAVKQVGALDVDEVNAGTIRGGSILFSYSAQNMLGAVAVTNGPTTNVVYSMNSNGVFTTSTVVSAQSTNVNVDVLKAAKFYGKSGVLVKSSLIATNMLTIEKPGTLITSYGPLSTNTVYAMNSAGIWATTTVVKASFTNTTVAATLGQTFAIVNGGASNYVFNPGSTVLPATPTITQAVNSVILLTPISDSKWKILATAP